MATEHIYTFIKHETMASIPISLSKYNSKYQDIYKFMEQILTK